MAPASYFGRVVSLVVFSLSYAFADHEHGGLRGDGYMGQTSSQAIHQALNNVHQTCRADLYSLCLNSASNPGSRRTLQEVRPPMGRQSLHHPGHGYAEGYGDHLGHGHGGPEGYGPPHHHHHNHHDMGMGMGGPAGPGGFWEPPPGMRDHAMPAREMGFDDEGPWEWASEVSDPSMVVESGEPVQLESFWPELEWVSQVQEEGWRTGWSGSSSSASTDESASADSGSFSSSDGSVSSDSVSSDSSSSDDSASWDWLTAAAASVLRARRRFLGQRAAAAPSPDAGAPRRRLVMMHPAMKEALLAEQQLAAAAEEEEEEEGPAALGAARRPPARASHGSRAGAADHLLPVLRDRAAARGAHGRGAPVARKAGGGGGGGEAAAGGPEGVPAPPQRLDGKAQQQAAPAHGSKPQPAPKPLPAKGPTDKPHRALAAQPRAPTPVLPPLGGPPRPMGNPPGGNGGNRRALMHQHGHKEWHAQWVGSSDSSDSWDSSSSDSSSSDDLGYHGYPGHYAYAPLGFGRADDQCLYDHLAAGELGAGCEAAVEQLQTAYLGALAAETARAEAEVDDCASFALGLLGLLLVAYVCRAAGLRRRLARCAPTHRVVQDHPELKAAVAEILQAHPEAYRGPACKVRCLVGAVAAVLSYALALFLLVSFLALGGGEEVEDEGDALFVSCAIAFLSCAAVALPLKAALRRRQRRARREAAGARAIAVQVGGPEGRAAGYAPLPLEEPGAPHSGDSQRVVFAGVPVTAPPLPNLTLHTVQVV